MPSVGETIAVALDTRSDVWMKYRNNQGKESARRVTPLEWKGSDSFLALCLESQQQLTFSVRNILECSLVADSSQEPPLQLEADQLPTPTLRQFPSVPQRKAEPAPISGIDAAEPFSEVKDGRQWSRLARYYRACLVVENRQQYVIDRNALFPFQASTADTHRFMQGNSVFEFPSEHLNKPTPVARFVRSDDHNSTQQLCLGFPLLVLDGSRVAPLIYCPVSVQNQPGKVVIAAEDFEISYAALMYLKFTEEEIDQFLAEFAAVESEASRLPIEVLEEKLLAKTGDLLGVPLAYSRGFTPYTLYERPGLFWVDANISTVNLIKELQDLAEVDRWDRVSVGLKTLLSLTPEHDYPVPPSVYEDANVSVTLVNAEQSRAVLAAQQEPLTVVTGPPGTGKSQLVLNLIANAALRGEKVLFASRNNGAVDIVMSRLQGELGYPGAIRTGNKTNKQTAIAQIEAALDRIESATSISPTLQVKDQYQLAKQKAIKAKEQLEQVKRLNGLLSSYQVERTHWLAQLSEAVAKLVTDNVPLFNAPEVERIQAEISELFACTMQLNEQQRAMGSEVTKVVVENKGSDSVVGRLRRFEDQRGSFGGGFLSPGTFTTAIEMHIYLETWQNLIAALDSQARCERAKDAYLAQSEAYGRVVGRLTKPRTDWVSAAAASHQPTDLQALGSRFTQLAKRFDQIHRNQLSFQEKLLWWLHLRNPLQDAIDRFTLLKGSFEIPWNDVSGSDAKDAGTLAFVCGQVADLIEVSLAYHRYVQLQGVWEASQNAYTEASSSLSDSIRGDLDQLSPLDIDSTQLSQALDSVLQRVNGLQAQIDQLADRINHLLDQNQYRLGVLEAFKASKAGKDRQLWVLPIPVSLVEVSAHLGKWHNLVSFWTADGAIRGLERQLGSLPAEAEAIEQAKEAADALLALGGDVIQNDWLERAKRMGNANLQNIRDYAAAVKILLGAYDRYAYGSARSRKDAYFPTALQLFPVWATTNLTAKSNFPLQAGLFDLVIIDEASQCDIASALPLLYRAKRVVIIGDPHQLKHVATITESSDAESAKRFGIDRTAFQYRQQSLFDVAERSVGLHPGKVLLAEHYRSDARIIGFSNREFYQNQLRIKTDLALKGISRAFLNDYGGLSWLHVAGSTERPETGSAYNPQEVAAIQDIIPRLIENLDMHGLSKSGIGIVTPFREQERRIRTWCETKYGSSGRIKVGTAHKFQGDECEFVIFSPVLAKGMTQGTLRWLETTNNLLNVAITRARVALIVVGDWEFCHSLPSGSVYHRLADYALDKQGQRIDQASDLPLLGGSAVQIIGYVLDPHNPEYNKTTLRRFLTSCRDYVWWVDTYFDNNVVVLFRDVLQDPTTRLREVRLLTTSEQTESMDGSRPKLRADRVRQLGLDLKGRGINFEVRILPKRDLGVHDRLLYSPSQAINMPPFLGAYGEHRHVSEYTQSNIAQGFFDGLWQKAHVVGTP